MQILVNNTQGYPEPYFKLFVRQHARINIIRANFTPTEIKLDQYLKAHFKFGLKPICLRLIDKADINYRADPSRPGIYWPGRFEEQLARLITFGTGPLLGSQILVKAFSRTGL